MFFAEHMNAPYRERANLIAREVILRQKSFAREERQGRDIKNERGTTAERRDLWRLWSKQHGVETSRALSAATDEQLIHWLADLLARMSVEEHMACRFGAEPVLPLLWKDLEAYVRPGSLSAVSQPEAAAHGLDGEKGINQPKGRGGQGEDFDEEFTELGSGGVHCRWCWHAEDLNETRRQGIWKNVDPRELRDEITAKEKDTATAFADPFGHALRPLYQLMDAVREALHRPQESGHEGDMRPTKCEEVDLYPGDDGPNPWELAYDPIGQLEGGRLAQ